MCDPRNRFYADDVSPEQAFEWHKRAERELKKAEEEILKMFYSLIIEGLRRGQKTKPKSKKLSR